MISLIEVKRQAALLKDFLIQNNTAISQSSCLQAVAKIHGFKDWNTLSAALKRQPQQPKENNFWGEPIQISDSVFLAMSNHGHAGNFGEDAYRLLTVILRNLKDNSLTVKNITYRSLWEKWTPQRFDNALNQLLNEKFIHRTYDDNENLVITINPLFFWRGNPEKHLEAIELFNMAIVSVNGLIPTIEFPENHNKSSLRSKKITSSNADISSIIAFAEDRNSKNSSPRKMPSLRLCDTVKLEDHPKLKTLQLFIKQQSPVSDPRILLMKVTEILGEKYYVGFGGTHIHVKTPDEKNEIAYITAGI